MGSDPLEEPLTSAARLVVATHNPGKLREIRDLLAAALPELDVSAAVVDAASAGLPDVRETGTSFEANALLKARAAAAHSGVPALADDSGLTVDVLGEAPGILSARWSGRHGDDAANLELLLAQLAELPKADRGARFVCAVALVTPDGREHVVRGQLRGSVLSQPVGEHGFGYDPIFAPEGEHGLSCAQLSPAHKNRISHRARALEQILPHVLAEFARSPVRAAERTGE